MDTSVARSEDSYVSWQWQCIVDQQKSFTNRVEDYVQKLNDKFFSCAGDVRDRLFEAAIRFLTQPVPEVDASQDVMKKPVTEREELDKLQDIVRRLEKQIEVGFQDELKKQSDKTNKLDLGFQDGLKKQSDRIDEMSVGLQDGLKKQSDRIDELDIGMQQKMKNQTDRIDKLYDKTESLKKSVELDKNDKDDLLEEMKNAINELRKQRNEDATKQQEDRKTLCELRDTQKLALKAYAEHLTQIDQSTRKPTQTQTNPGAAAAPTSISQTPASRPKAATIIQDIRNNQIFEHFGILSRELVLLLDFPHLKLYSDQGQLLQESNEGLDGQSRLAVLQELQVAVTSSGGNTLHLVKVTKENISTQSSHKLSKPYFALASVDGQTLAMVFGNPAIGLDIVDLKGQVLRTFCSVHNISHICSSGDGSILCSGDGQISRYDVNTQTETFCVRAAEACEPRAVGYLPSSDSIVVYDRKTKSLLLLDGSSGEIITKLFNNIGDDLRHIAINDDICMCSFEENILVLKLFY